MKMLSSQACPVMTTKKTEAEAVTMVAAPPSPPPLPPTKKTKQGISSILQGTDSENRANKSIRRTLSADMSSQNWLSEINNVPGQDEVWRSIQVNKLERNEKQQVKPPLRSCESWSSILMSQKTEDCSASPLPPPYVHPMVKRTTSSLSEKSLEICTESLGSETGSDGFSSHTSPPDSDSESEEKDQSQSQHNQLIQEHDDEENEDEEVIKEFECSPGFIISKKLPPQSFPPPLPSLSKDKASVQVLSRRSNGRLILEAVSVPPQDYLRAERHDGRLLLTFVNGSEETEDPDYETEDPDEETEDLAEETEDSVEETEETEDSVEETGEVFDYIEDDNDDYREDIDEEEIAADQTSKLPDWSLFMNQITGLNCKKNTTWSNKAVKFVEDDDDYDDDVMITPLPPPTLQAAGLIPAPPSAATAFVNTYDYFWRKKPTVASLIDIEQSKHTTTTKAMYLNSNNNINKSNSNDNIVESKKFAGYEHMIPLLRGCKEPRRTLLLWEPYCIATT